MVDLKGQYDRIQDQVNASVLGAIESTKFINGPQVKSFQEHLEGYLGVKHVIPCANGTDALQIALMALGLKPGDEVITADFTFAATVEALAISGLQLSVPEGASGTLAAARAILEEGARLLAASATARTAGI